MNSVTDTTYPAPSPSPLSTIPDSVPFVLAVQHPNRSLRARQSFDYIGPAGRVTSDCSHTNNYLLLNGQLFLTNSSGTLQFSARAGQSYAQFVPSANPGPIITTFQLGQGGSLMWMNDAFPLGNALFCMQWDGTILAVFVSGSQPDGCIFITLTISDVTGCMAGMPGPTGPQGIQGVQGPQGIQGPQGSPGPQGASGPTGPQGPQGSQGVQGPQGSQGVQGPQGSQGVQGPQGSPGSQGIPGPTGAQGLTGPQGAQGIQGIQGSQGIPGPTGPAGPVGSPGLAWSYLGCFVQTGTTISAAGKALSSFQQVYASNVNTQCAQKCQSLSFTYFGTVNNSTAGATAGDCYCGNAINYITSGFLIGKTGDAGDNNCGVCLSGYGACGIYASQTVAIFSRAF